MPSDSLLARSHPALRADRLQHAGLSLTLAAAATLATDDARGGFAISLSLGALKEWWDSRRSRADAMDLAADAAGAALGSLAARAVRR